MNIISWILFLDLAENLIKSEGASAIGKCLETNKTLKEVCLGIKLTRFNIFFFWLIIWF